MAITVNWADAEQSIINLEFQPGWTWDDLYVAIRQADALIISVDHTVHLLIDIRKAGGLPGDFMRVAGDIFDSGEARANEGQKVVVGAGRLLQMAYGAFLRVYGHRLKNRPFHFTGSLDEAYALLKNSNPLG